MSPEDARRQRLLAGAAALGVDLADAQTNRLLAYLDLLQRWNRVYNLTAVRDPDEMLVQHLLDCLAVWPPLQRQAEAQAPGQPLKLLDVGSGGGLPGVVLAILAPAWTVTCVDTVAKKASFIRQVAGELGQLNLKALHARVETLSGQGVRFDLVTSRAFASLADFVNLSAGLLAEGGVWMAMKGKSTADEQAALPANVAVFHVEQLHVPGLDAERCLVWMQPAPAAA
ncbi:16S rRNA (guanine(527)-N(7))-methyltransferase GidB [Burkholderiales bacterium JOSHI_001]|nr:16S rRNA (guanine(527)-N(7))-methyltransferase GidB [Burkholderiales bacterium JOSHI_001]